MIAVEYLGGLPGRETPAPIKVEVQRGALHLKRGGLLGGWTYHLPLAAIARVELTTAQEIAAKGLLPLQGAALPSQSEAALLAIDAPLAEHAPGTVASIILRGPWATLSTLRQEVLKGRMQAAKQWHS